MNRAYGLIDVKSVDEDARVITGIASSVSTDRMGDVVESRGAKFSLPMPLLWQHKSDLPVGWVQFAERGDNQITFRAQLAKLVDPGPLRDAVETAWQAVKSQLVRGVSIGFRAIDAEPVDKKDPWGGIRFKEWEWLELSLVTIPANQDASIQTIRSLDAQSLAATGNERKPSSQPGVSGTTLPKHKEKRAMPPTIQEQITSFENKRAADMAAMEALMSKAVEDGAALDAEQAGEYDGLEAQVKQVDEHLVRLRKLEKINLAKATAVKDVKDVETASQVRGAVPRIEVKTNQPKGTAFTRYVIAMLVSKGNTGDAISFAKTYYKDNPELISVIEAAPHIKAAVAAGTTTDSTWASPLVVYQQMASEFIELLRPATIIGRIPGLRRVPFNISMPKQTAGMANFGWVGEGVPKPLGKLDFTTVNLRWAKAAGIVVFTEELARFSNPSAEAVVRQDLIASCAQFLDHEFLDPDKSAVTNVSPAGITNGITPIQASGTTSAALRLDVLHLMTPMLAAELSMATAVWIMSPTQAMALSLMQNALGQTEFPDFDIPGGGGRFLGLPVVLSENLATGQITLLIANEIFLADDGGVNIDVSREASLQMDSAPTNPPGTSTIFTSLWQMNLVGVRAERFINWQRRRDAAVGYIANAGYGGAPGGSGT